MASTANMTGMAPFIELCVVAGANGDVTVPRMVAGDVVISCYASDATDYTAAAVVTSGGKLNAGNTTGKTLHVLFARRNTGGGPVGDYGAVKFQHNNL